jgi:N-(2-amino-2-carboxyethyl)-L-glutamate synthase
VYVRLGRRVLLQAGINDSILYIDLRPTFGRSLFLKCEGFNFAGSIKLKAATEMVEAADREGALRPGSILVESSSGDLGVALSVIAASAGTWSSRAPPPRSASMIAPSS